MKVPDNVRGPAMRGAWAKGYRARQEGKPRRAPYYVGPGVHGDVTWGVGMARYWCDGWDACDKEMR